MKALLTTVRRLACLSLAASALFFAGCGRPDGLVVVNVTGIDTAVRELYVTMTLDGQKAKNSQPTPDDDKDGLSFSVYQNMQQFGIDVPSGTRVLGVDVNGLNTARVVVATGTGSLDVTQSQDLDIALHTP